MQLTLFVCYMVRRDTKLQPLLLDMPSDILLSVALRNSNNSYEI